MVRTFKRLKNFKISHDQEKSYPLDSAVEYLNNYPKVKFDETIEVHLNLNVDLKNSDQSLRGTVKLPNGSGKKVKIAAVCKGELEKKAKDAGADVVGAEDLIEKISKGFMDFDVVIASPDMMRELSKLGKILGPRGLMPTPKAGTVAADIERAVKEVKAGKIEFKTDKQGGIHVGVGKRSFSKEKIVENIQHLLDAINLAKPASVKGALIKSAYISTTMGQSVRLVI